MTDDFDDQHELPGALGIEARAADWLARKKFWNWSADDQLQLDAWLAQSPAHEIAFWRLQGTLARTERLAALRPAKAPMGWGPLLARVAAAMVLIGVVSAAGYFAYPSRPDGVAYATSVGGRETVVLSDGTRIELNTDTAIRVAETTDARTIHLDRGEAYFQVVHNAARPLVVYADERRITDIGTEFSVRREHNKLEVAVVEGKVNVDAPHDRHALLLTAGETMVATAKSISVTRKSERTLANDLGWRRGIVVFDGTRLADAVQEINRYNSRKIILTDANLANVTLTATITANDPEQFIRMARFLLGNRGGDAAGKILISQ